MTMNKKLPEPITKKTFEKMVSQWARVVKYNESASIYFYSKAGLLRRFHQLLNDKKIYQKYFEAQKIKIIDVNAFVLEEEEDWQKALDIKNKSNIFFILGMDQILLKKNKRALTFLEEKEAQNPNWSFLFFFNLDFSHPDFWSILKTKSVFIQNTIFLSLYKKEDDKQFIDFLEIKWDLSLSQKLKDEILKECGGNFWLVKQAMRFLRDNPEAEEEKEIFNHQQMKWRLEMIWKKFLKSEKTVFKKIIKKQNKFNKKELHSLKFLKKTGWIRKNDREITIPLLKRFLNKKREKFSLKLGKRKRIFLNNVSVEKNFSNKEKAVLTLLLKNKDKVVDRERIADSLWSGIWEEKYSDWAIDQTISRLRKRLVFLGLSSGLIKTVRGKGFVLSTKSSD
mgnify:CR=1 FL=1